MEAAMPDGEGSERRVNKRIPFIHDVEVEGLGNRRCLDISIGGMYLESPVSFPEETIVDLKIRLNSKEEQPLELQARVMYIHEGVGMGLSFVNLSSEVKEKIKLFIERS